MRKKRIIAGCVMFTLGVGLVFFLVNKKNTNHQEVSKSDTSRTIDNYSNYKKDDSQNINLREYKLGEEVNLGDRKITVYGFQSYSESSMKSLYQTSSGVAMDVLVESVSNAPFYLNPLQFTVQDKENRALTYYDVIPGGMKPTLRIGEVAPGQKIRAYITYADTKKPSVIFYKSSERQTVKIVVE